MYFFRWRLFYRPIPLATTNTIKVVKCSIVLHNLLQRRNEVIGGKSKRKIKAFEKQEDVCEHPTALSEKEVRDKFCAYYNHFGTVGWQEKMINDTEP